MGVVLTSPRPAHGALNWDTAIEADLQALASAINVTSFGVTDLNAITSSGLYYGSNLTNAPGGLANGFVVWHGWASASNQAQIALNINTNAMGFRTKLSGTWSAWKTVTAN
jgi:hypothetical protein